MRNIARRLATMFAVAAAAAWGHSASAQPVPRSPQEVPRAISPDTAPPLERGEGVLDRQRPEYDAVGIRVGPFFIFPALQIGESYDDNIYATSSGEESDFVTEIAPTIQVRSNFGRHRLNFDFGAIQRLYAEHSTENTLTGILSAQSALELTSASSVFGGIRALFGAEPRGSADVPTSAEKPIPYRVFSGNVGYSNAATAFPFQLTGTLDRYEFSDVPLVGGGNLDSESRNRVDYSAAVRVGYALWANVVPFVQAAINTRIYDRADANGLVRDSIGFSTAAGASLDLGGLITGEVFAGYAQQNYRSSLLGTISGPDIGASLRWNVTPLVTLRFEARTLVSETTLQGAAGSIDTRVRFIADHEVLRNVLLNLSLGYSHIDYRGISRADDYYNASIGARYLVNSNLSVDASYNFTDRQSDFGGVSYNRDVFLVRLRLQY